MQNISEFTTYLFVIVSSVCFLVFFAVLGFIVFKNQWIVYRKFRAQKLEKKIRKKFLRILKARRKKSRKEPKNASYERYERWQKIRRGESPKNK